MREPEIKDRNHEIALRVLVEKQTLSSLAEEYDLTQERIRQIAMNECKKSNRKLYISLYTECWWDKSRKNPPGITVLRENLSGFGYE